MNLTYWLCKGMLFITLTTLDYEKDGLPRETFCQANCLSGTLSRTTSLLVPLKPRG